MQTTFLLAWLYIITDVKKKKKKRMTKLINEIIPTAQQSSPAQKMPQK